MADSGKRGRWRRMLRYAIGGVLCLLAVINVLVGAPWPLALGGAVTGGIILIGHRRIFRAGVSRTGDEIVCRYIPWYEGNAYSALVLLPLMGVAMVALGLAPGNPRWLLYGGVILLAGVTPLSLWGIVRMWLRSLLCFSPSMLTVRLAERGSQLTEIRRELVASIEPKLVPLPSRADSLQVAIAYRPAEIGDGTTKTVLLGLRLTVPPVNLLNALIAWRDGARDDPGELLDRIEGILRGRSTAGV
ncbi:MAG: hypothetical protein VX424_10580 [Actinomycetota bacterium]|nr:hypothetical protein [Actinomycetota bacterium]